MCPRFQPVAQPVTGAFLSLLTGIDTLQEATGAILGGFYIERVF